MIAAHAVASLIEAKLKPATKHNPPVCVWMAARVFAGVGKGIVGTIPKGRMI
jgi:hypothetical protein